MLTRVQAWLGRVAVTALLELRRPSSRRSRELAPQMTPSVDGVAGRGTALSDPSTAS